MYISGIIFSIIVILATCLPFLKISKWYIRGWDFPRLQILVVAFISFTLLLFSNGSNAVVYSVCGIIIICIVVQIYFILPYTPLWGKEVRQTDGHDIKDTISLLICNVYMNNKERPTCLEVASSVNADVLLFVETDKWWVKYFEPLEKTYPYSIKYPLDNTYGMLVYSRYELIDAEIKFLIKDYIPSIHTKAKLPSGKEIELRFVHPEPPAPGESSTSKGRDAELILIAKEVKKLNTPVIVGGDLNDVAWSRTTRLFQRISRLLDPRKGRGMFNTFNAKYPFFRWPLDHIFFSSHFSLISIQKCKFTGSDHFPIFLKLKLDGNGEKSSPDKADAEDKEEANKKVKEGKDSK